MTVVCDKCGRPHFVARAVGRMGHLLRVACPHCGQYLWSNTPRPRPRAPSLESSAAAWPLQTRGFS